jgi:DNA-binding PadR family transcriptional regulator
MKGKRLAVDFIELHILHHASEAPVYGFWMLEELGHHGYRLSASHLYPRFHRLVRQRLLRQRREIVDGKLRKYYLLTSRGRRHWEGQKRRLLELVSEALTEAELRRVLEKKP